jgi:hypothetical protein
MQALWENPGIWVPEFFLKMAYMKSIILFQNGILLPFGG